MLEVRLARLWTNVVPKRARAAAASLEKQLLLTPPRHEQLQTSTANTRGFD